MTVQIYNIESLPKLCLDSVRVVLIFWINPEEGKENIHMLSRRKMNTFPDHKKFAHTARSLACFWCTSGGQKISERLRKNSDVFLVAHRVSINTLASSCIVTHPLSCPCGLSHALLYTSFRPTSHGHHLCPVYQLRC